MNSVLSLPDFKAKQNQVDLRGSRVEGQNWFELVVSRWNIWQLSKAGAHQVSIRVRDREVPVLGSAVV